MAGPDGPCVAAEAAAVDGRPGRRKELTRGKRRRRKEMTRGRVGSEVSGIAGNRIYDGRFAAP